MIKAPLDIVKGHLAVMPTLKDSIDQSLNILVTTPLYQTPSDPMYGFVFNNLRFEMFNENEGTVYNSDTTEDIDYLAKNLYNRKVSGSSKSTNTFAAELKTAVLEYEKRLEEVSTSMTYKRQERRIYLTIRARIRETGEPYVYNSIIKVWN